MSIILPEELTVGYFDSNVAYSGVEITPKRNVTCFELEIPLEKGGISYNGENEIAIEPNFIVCAKPGQVRYTKTPFKVYFIKFSLCDGKVCDILKGLPDYIKTYRYEKYYEIFRKVFIQYNLRKTDNFTIYGLLLELVDMMADDCKSSADNEQLIKSGVAVQAAIVYIKEHLTEDLSLEKIATGQGYSPIYFHKLFKTAMGQTLHDYVEELRIEKAITMLLETDYTVTKVAYECGFSSQSYFNHVFKRRMKKTPRKYIQEKQEESANSYKSTDE